MEKIKQLKKIIFSKVKTKEKKELIEINAWIQYFFIEKLITVIFASVCIYWFNHTSVFNGVNKNVILLLTHIGIQVLVSIWNKRSIWVGIAIALILITLDSLLKNYSWIKILIVTLLFAIPGARYISIWKELKKRRVIECAEQEKKKQMTQQSFENIINRAKEIIEKWDDDKKIAIFRWHDVVKYGTNYWLDHNWIISLNQKLKSNTPEGFEINLTHRELFPEAYSMYNTEGRILINKK